MTFGSLFSGIGGLDLGLERAGMRCVWQVEKDEFCRRVLAKHWPDVRRHDDVRTFPAGDGADWRCDLVCGGFPCQDVSNTGLRQGIDGERSGLWSEYARIVGVLRPRYVLVENVTGLLDRGIDRVLGDLARFGYDAEWSVVSACALGAPHTRERVFVIAYPASGGWPGAQDSLPRIRAEDAGETGPREAEQTGGCAEPRWGLWWLCEPGMAAVDHGLSARLVGRPNRAIGNAVVPQVAEWIGRRILEGIR